MQFKQPFLCVFIALIIPSKIFANTHNYPERPTVISPQNGASYIDIRPFFESSEFILKNETDEVFEDIDFIESEYLILEETNVILVAGSNFKGDQLDSSESVNYNISDMGLTLSGEAIDSMLINHKGVEFLSGSNNRIAYMELPDFIWQAENTDTYQAIRFEKHTNGALTVEWNYGDSSASTPWDIRVQAILFDGLMGLTIKDDDFTSDFVRNHNLEKFKLCDEANCYSRYFISIFHYGNGVFCELLTISDNCSLAHYSTLGFLDDLSVTEVAYYKNIPDVNYSTTDSLEFKHTYQVLTRQSGSLEGGPSIVSGWSESNRFTTRAAEADLSVEVIAPETIYMYEDFSMTYRITNTGVDAISSAGIYIITPLFSPNNAVSYVVPEGCEVYDMGHLYCSGKKLEPGTFLDINIQGVNTGKQVKSTYEGMVNGLVPVEFNGYWSSAIPSDSHNSAENNNGVGAIWILFFLMLLLQRRRLEL